MSLRARVVHLGCVLLFLSSALVHCADEGAVNATATDLSKRIEAASEAQEFGEKIETVAGEVSVAPAVKLSAGTGDIDTGGPCSEDIQIFCPQVKPGAAHIAECISNQIADEKEGKSEFTAKVTEGCKKEILNFKMALSTNINFDVQMATACKADAAKFCQYTKDLDFPGKVIACLREKKPKLSGKCRTQIHNAQMAAAEDFRLDAQLYEACKADAANVCADVKPGSGRVNACLRENRPKVSWDCQEELFRADVENADDVRLSVRLFRTCIKEKQTFCGVVAPGNARAKDCLEQNRDKPGFGEDCKNLIEKMMADRARDFRLDVRLREQCAADIENLCLLEKDSLQAVANGDSRVVECLQDFREELMNPECKKAVHSTMERGASDIRFDVSLAEACYDDRQKYCGTVKPGSARVIRCLQDRRELLKEDCRATLFDHEVRISESIDFNLPMKQACTAEIGKFCAGIPTGHARVIRCLQENKSQADFSPQCKKEVISFEHNQSRDYRLNFRLASACEDDIYALCHESCDMYSGRACGGRVLRCLTERKDELKAEACKAEVFYFIKMEVTDYGNDVILAEACRADVDKLCKDVKPGEGRVHECLRSPENRKELSIACRNEELKLEIMETSNIELRPSLKRQCADERQVFCKDVKTGRARVFRCLIQNIGKVDFGANCRGEIVRKLQRRQQNWKLDVNLRTQCKADVDRLCADVDHDSDHAEVVRCLMSKKDELVEPCAREVGRAAHMSLYVWRPDSALSKVCDADINKTCIATSPVMANFPGKVLTCLENSIKQTTVTGTNAKTVSPECKAFVDVAEPPDEKLEYEKNLQGVALTRIKSGMQSAGFWDKRRGVTVTGYSALAAFSALCTVIIMGLYTAYKRWRGIKDGYTMVLKSGDV